MIIKELELSNIRSHGHSLIRFPLGKTLLEGDIGSGKSSVLMAIEFALFGLGSDSGGSILRLGQDSGEVRIVFEIDGSGYEVTRRLQRRSGRVQQTDGVLKTPAETLSLSPSELKEKVLEVLEFNEVPDPKAQSWIYRYAVYTPQEEMKNILALANEQRLQILRRAFKVEDYKTAATNAEEASRQIRLDSSRLDGVSQGVDELRQEVEQLQQEEERLKSDLGGLEDAESRADEGVGRLKEEREGVRKHEMSLQGVKAEREYYERLRSDAAKDVKELEEEARKMRGEIAKAEAYLAEAGKNRPRAPRPIAEIRRRERSLETRAKKLTGLRAATDSKLSDYESIMRSGVCPVCDRPAEAHAFEEKRTRKVAEREHIMEELEGVEGELSFVRLAMDEAEKYRDLERGVAERKRERSRLKEEALKKEGTLGKFEKRSEFAAAFLQELEKKLEELDGVLEQGRVLDKKVAQAEGALRKVGEELAKVKERLESGQKQQTKLAIEIVAKEGASNESMKLKEREIWLGDYFVPTVKTIEKSVLATVNQEFDTLFKRWFGVLVADPEKEVSVDEDFAPIVSQGGYEQDIEYLSGGERTSVALAYRLALNLLTQRSSVGMNSNLLILDEPTDGFSKEQLGNVREVLDEVGCPQVIIVSHDKELESFADQIFRVERAQGESVVKGSA